MNAPLHLPPLYVVCDDQACAAAGWSLPDFAAACLDGGATLLQLRSKHGHSRELLAQADTIVARAHAMGARVIVNDRADVARLSGADGVHVGQDDLSPADARAVVGPDVVVGLSTHTDGQLEAALAAPIDYVAIGPVFGTRTKDTGYAPVGVERVRAVAARAARAQRPVVAIGGMTIERAPAVIAAGAASVAVISDLFVSNDPASRVRAYLHQLSRV